MERTTQRRLGGTGVLFLGSLALWVVGCSCQDDPTGPDDTDSGLQSCGTTADCDGDLVCVQNVCVPMPDGGVDTDASMPIDVLDIEVEPKSVTLTSTNGSKPTQEFKVWGLGLNDQRVLLDDAAFELGSNTLGTIDSESGVFESNGTQGGTVKVVATVSLGGTVKTADATVVVNAIHEEVGVGLPMDVADKFATVDTDEDFAATIVYPLDGAVMPQNVYPADVQWDRGEAGDIFRVTIAKPSVSVTAYVAYESTRHWLVGEDAWRSLAQSDVDDDAVFSVDRYVASEDKAYSSNPVNVRFAKAALNGSIYYWDIARGRIVRINDGTATRDEFMPNPNLNCVGCHSVSSSGRYMVGRHGGGDNVGNVYDLTQDLTGDPPPTLFDFDDEKRWWGSTWAPDESRIAVIINEPGIATNLNEMLFLDPFTGDPVSVTGSLPEKVIHPSWSPDGTQIAYIGNTNTWGGNNTTGNVYTIDVTAPDTVANPTQIHDGTSLMGAAEGGVADSYPTWSIDSELIAFAHGDGSRSEVLGYQSRLYSMNRDGSNVVALDKAGSAGLEEFQPNYSPFNEGGYYWLSFLSRRDYGNDEQGTQGTRRQQIWVTAIKNNAGDGEDPSSVPYWLPGQATSSMNIAAYWAPRACRPDGEDCTVNAECCGGNCQPNEMDELVCTPPPPDRCRLLGETCTNDEDCCSAPCINNVCSVVLE